jgi:hypothetical protein
LGSLAEYYAPPRPFGNAAVASWNTPDEWDFGGQAPTEPPALNASQHAERKLLAST